MLTREKKLKELKILEGLWIKKYGKDSNDRMLEKISSEISQLENKNVILSIA